MKNSKLITAGIAIAAALLCLNCGDNSGRSPSGDDDDANSFVNKFHRGDNPVTLPPNNPCANGATPECCAYNSNYAGCQANPPQPITYMVTVISGTGGGNYAAGATVTITANSVSGKQFTNWTSTSSVQFANANSATTTFAMPSGAVSVTANYETIPATTYTLTINRVPTNGGSTNPASPQSNIAAGTAVNISATANNDYTFNNWTLTSGTATFGNANSASTTVTLSADATIQANFNTSGDPSYTYTGGMVKIGNQTWMKKNLDRATPDSKCYGNSADSCAKYGRLYTWSDAKTACPSGWHLPSDAEWTILVNYVENANSCSDCAGTKLKSTTGWNGYEGKSGNGTDDYEFSALPGGSGYSGGNFDGAGYYGNWWSATENDASYAWARSMYYYFETVIRSLYVKSYLLAVRCVGD